MKNLAVDNVVSDGAKGFSDLGIKPTAMKIILDDYLWVYRPHGQFEAVRESAKGLREY